mgnify:CR=1 FL=1
MFVNGKKLNTESKTIHQLIVELNLNSEKIVVEVNGSIVQKKDYYNSFIYSEDTIEIVSFVGGG